MSRRADLRRARRTLLNPDTPEPERDAARQELVGFLSARGYTTRHAAAAALMSEGYGSGDSPGGVAADEKRAQLRRYQQTV